MVRARRLGLGPGCNPIPHAPPGRWGGAGRPTPQSLGQSCPALLGAGKHSRTALSPSGAAQAVPRPRGPAAV